MKEVKLISADLKLVPRAVENSREAENPNSEPILIETIKASDLCFMALVDNEVACIFGLHIQNIVLGHAYIWLFITGVVEENDVLFIRKSKEFMDNLAKRYTFIHGHLDPRYADSKRWLEWLDFTFDGPDARMGNALAFHRGER